MLISMTGFGDAHQEQAGLSVFAEIRSINSRFFKMNLRLSEGCGPFEPRIEPLVRKKIHRGTVNISLRVVRNDVEDKYRINQAVLLGYYNQIKSISSDLQGADTPGLESLLMLPGVVDVNDSLPSSSEYETEWLLVKSTLSEALDHLLDMRHKEGLALADDLKANANDIASHLKEIDRIVPEMVTTYQAKLTDRLNKLLEKYDVSVEASDVVREVGMFAERSDISEEIVRLTSHLDQFTKIIEAPEHTGKKLEFLIQEMLREANTIGSKANNADVVRRVVEIKTSIERMREQIQNCE